MASVSGAASSLFSAHPAVAATQTHEGGNTVIHMEDGSTITVVGVTHFDSSFVH